MSNLIDEISTGWRRPLHSFLDRIGIWPLVVVVALVQTAVLGSMIWDRVTLLKTGREVVVDVVPVDPRSLFRGDYVILNYAISQIDLNDVEGEPKRGDVVYVTLEKPSDGNAWAPVAAVKEKQVQNAKHQVVVRATVTGRSSRQIEETKERVKTLRLKYGAERYFVEEGKGKVIEKQITDKKIQVVWAVNASGTAAVKALMVDGVRVYDEPLY